MKDEKMLAAAREILGKFLKSRGMRHTPERDMLLEKVFSSAEHFYIDVLCEALELEGFHVSRSTVYANMQIFLDAGLVRRHQFGNQPAQYERYLPGSGANHIHLVCSVCGRVKEVKDMALAEVLLSRNYAGFRPRECALYVYGICGRCERLAAQQQKSASAQPRKATPGYGALTPQNMKKK